LTVERAIRSICFYMSEITLFI